MASFTAQPTYHNETHEAVASKYEKERLRIKNGQCPTCGMQTHKKKGLIGKKTLVPLNNDHVCHGRCLHCKPLSLAPASSPAPAPPPSDQIVSRSLGSASSAPAPSSPTTASTATPSNRRCERTVCGVFGWGEYDGEINNKGRRHGKGAFTWDTGHKYDGEWRSGKQHGRGTHTYADGTVYVGEYNDGQKEGRGRETYANGDMYEGMFRNGQKEGHGKYVKANGNVYDGEWKDGKSEGHGTYSHSDGKVEVGQYRAGKDVGEGACWSANRTTAWRLQNGKQQGVITLDEAAVIAGRLGLPVPP